MKEAVAIAKQIAAALEAGHQVGIIHRDLKPANIKLKQDGTVKLLDYGLAKALEGETPGGAESDVSQSPTLTRQGTQHGVILGTASYMSPEQARGRSLDKRTDIWAFGCCLYEMLTGRLAFGGETITDILAAVVHREPTLELLPPSATAGVKRLLRRCLEKDPRERLHDIADARLELRDALTESATPPAPSAGAASKTPMVAMALLTLASLGVAIWSSTREPPDSVRPMARFVLPLAAEQELEMAIHGPSVAVSRDGQYFAWTVRAPSGERRLFLRSASELRARPVEGAEGAASPFFSPDGEWLGFSVNRRYDLMDGTSLGSNALERQTLWKVPLSGGAPVKITEFEGTSRGATWASDGTILFSAQDRLQRVSSDGGDPTVVAAPVAEDREKSLRFPDALPGGNAVIFTSGSADMETWDDARIAVLSLDDGVIRTLFEGGTNPRYSPTGHIVYTRGERLFAVPFDAGSLEVTGVPVVVLEPVSTFPDNGPAQFALSSEGTLLYAPGSAWTSPGRVLVVSREGVAEPLVEAPRWIRSLRLAPDGRHLAIELQGANHGLWTYDMDRGTLTRLLSGFNNFDPVWSPDGRAVAWGHDARGLMDIYRTTADGSGDRELLSAGDGPAALPESWSPDGRFLLYNLENPGAGIGLMALSLDDRSTRTMVSSDAEAGQARFSPDGKWFAHVSDETGRPEVYIRSFSEPGAKWQVSTDGGDFPRWNPRGGELFFRAGDKVMVVEIELGSVPVMGRPRLLFEKAARSEGGVDFDVLPDGEHFVMTDISEALTPPKELAVFQDFGAELERLAPTEP